MTDPALALEPNAPLVDLLDEHFTPTQLERRIGLDAVLSPRLWEKSLWGPLRDFLNRPGKEFRARVVALSWELAGKRGEPPADLPLVIEAIHAGSLIIDDIEDESPYRRGLPALHRLYGTPVAINAGNWLYFWALDLIGQLQLQPSAELLLQRRTARTLLRCHQGQALDLGVRLSDLAQAEVPELVLASTSLKTGCLMALASSAGAIAASAPTSTVRVLEVFGERLGIALQMLDDLGGLVSKRRCYKGHEDLVHDRPTWPWAWLAQDLEPARFTQLADQLRQVREGHLHPEKLAAQMREPLGSRGKLRVHRYLSEAFSELGKHVPLSPALNNLKQEIARLESSYE